MLSAFMVSHCMLFFYSVTTDLVVSVKKCCGCNVPLRWCGQSSRDPTVCEPTGMNSGPSPQYFAQGNHSRNSGIYRRKSVTTVPTIERKHLKKSMLIIEPTLQFGTLFFLT